MSHDHEHHNPDGEKKSKTALRSSFWFMVILVALFVAALNFVSVMSNEPEEHEEGAPKTEESEHHAPAMVPATVKHGDTTINIEVDTSHHSAH